LYHVLRDSQTEITSQSLGFIIIIQASVSALVTAQLVTRERLRLLKPAEAALGHKADVGVSQRWTTRRTEK